jgi:hypothetical protein
MIILEPAMLTLPLRLFTPLALLIVLSGCNSKADSTAEAPSRARYSPPRSKLLAPA